MEDLLLMTTRLPSYEPATDLGFLVLSEAVGLNDGFDIRVIDIPTNHSGHQQWSVRSVSGTNDPNQFIFDGDHQRGDTNPLFDQVPSNTIRNFILGYCFVAEGQEVHISKRMLLKLIEEHDLSIQFVMGFVSTGSMLKPGYGLSYRFQAGRTYDIWYNIPYHAISPVPMETTMTNPAHGLPFLFSTMHVFSVQFSAYLKYDPEQRSSANFIRPWGVRMLTEELKNLNVREGGIGHNPFYSHLLFLNQICIGWMLILAGALKELHCYELGALGLPIPPTRTGDAASEADINKRLHHMAAHVVCWVAELEQLVNTMGQLQARYNHCRQLFGDWPHRSEISDMLNNMAHMSKSQGFKCSEIKGRVDVAINLMFHRLNTQTSERLQDITSAGREDSYHIRTMAEQAREDGRTMAQIAIATKRDSAAMKSIALVTLLYLPVAVVAGIFGTDFVQVDGEPGNESLRFSKPWPWFAASSAVLTCLTVGTWFGWMWWEESRNVVQSRHKGDVEVQHM